MADAIDMEQFNVAILSLHIQQMRVEFNILVGATENGDHALAMTACHALLKSNESHMDMILKLAQPIAREWVGPGGSDKVRATFNRFDALFEEQGGTEFREQAEELSIREADRLGFTLSREQFTDAPTF